ncbi:hypothetical protein T484DRAFT_1833052 [Baffinella frigidus]|nr:hypothetical protein T484DRAFT_1833052 [Cryptophyta sp. CCMP2293]
MASNQPKAVSESDRVSAEIGDRLLKGWTLLAESCPLCVLTPLVRSRAGVMYCVCCQMEVITPPESLR